MTTSGKTASLPAIIKRARDIMRKDPGLNGDADRIPQIAWLLFLKALDDLESTREVIDPNYSPALASPYRWRDWAADSTTRRSGDAMMAFVNDRLLPHLAGLSAASGSTGLSSKETVGQIFRDTRNRMLSGYLLADLVDQINRVSFASNDDVHTMAQLYESMLREMRDAAGDAGEFYTPRPVIRFIVDVVNPQPGEKVMDPAVGTGGFLVEAWDHVKGVADQSDQPAQQRSLMRGSFRGFEKKPMPFLLGQMNLMLHGLEDPRITRGNALTFSPAEQRRDGVDVILTNPPFGGEEEVGVKEYFASDLRTSETSWLFLQSVMERISRSPVGRCGIVVPNGVLFDQAVGAKIKKKLVENFNLHTIVRMPNGTFSPYTLIPTNILFFEAGSATSDIWFYEHPLPSGRRSYTKTKPLRFEELDALRMWWGGDRRTDREQNAQAWKVPVSEIVEDNYNLDVKNPHRPDDLAHKDPSVLLNEILEVQGEITAALRSLKLAMDERAS